MYPLEKLHFLTKKSGHNGACRQNWVEEMNCDLQGPEKPSSLCFIIIIILKILELRCKSQGGKVTFLYFHELFLHFIWGYCSNGCSSAHRFSFLCLIQWLINLYLQSRPLSQWYYNPFSPIILILEGQSSYCSLSHPFPIFNQSLNCVHFISGIHF